MRLLDLLAGVAFGLAIALARRPAPARPHRPPTRLRPSLN